MFFVVAFAIYLTLFLFCFSVFSYSIILRMNEQEPLSFQGIIRFPLLPLEHLFIGRLADGLPCIYGTHEYVEGVK